MSDAKVTLDDVAWDKLENSCKLEPKTIDEAKSIVDCFGEFGKIVHIVKNGLTEDNNAEFDKSFLMFNAMLDLFTRTSRFIVETIAKNDGTITVPVIDDIDVYNFMKHLIDNRERCTITAISRSGEQHDELVFDVYEITEQKKVLVHKIFISEDLNAVRNIITNKVEMHDEMIGSSRL